MGGGFGDRLSDVNRSTGPFVIVAFALAALGQPVLSAPAAPPVALGQPTASLGATASGSVRVARSTFLSTSRKAAHASLKELVATARKVGRQLSDLSRCAETDCRLRRLHRVCSTLHDLSDEASLAEDLIGPGASANATEAFANCDLAADALRRQRHAEAARHVVLMNTRIGDAATDIVALVD